MCVAIYKIDNHFHDAQLSISMQLLPINMGKN